MTYKTSYSDIVSKCLLIDFVEEALTRYEIWEDTKYKYKCIWFSSNDWLMPNFIQQTYGNSNSILPSAASTSSI